jgi:hypothetical protein
MESIGRLSVSAARLARLLLPPIPKIHYHRPFGLGKTGMLRCAHEEAQLAMRSSAATAVRAFVMLACAVGIPALAISGASWSEVVKKFQNVRWPAILTPASASPAVAQNEASPFRPSCAKGLPIAAGDATGNEAAHAAKAALQASSPTALPEPNQAGDVGFRSVQDRLQSLGATYYLLESWGNDQQLYRFYCKVAVAGNAAYAHCFEAIHADPLQAMLQVLRQVESWRRNDEARLSSGEESAKSG